MQNDQEKYQELLIYELNLLGKEYHKLSTIQRFLSPDSLFNEFFDILLCISIIYFIFEVPLNICFGNSIW